MPLKVAMYTYRSPARLPLDHVTDFCQIVAPFIFRSILIFVQQSQDAGTSPPPVAQGFGLALAWFAVSQIQNLVYQRWNAGSLKTGLYIRTALIDLVYQKATTLSSKSHLLYPDGSRWIAFRVQVLGPLLTISSALFVVGARFTINAATAGLVLSYLARTSSDMNFVVQTLAALVSVHFGFVLFLFFLSPNQDSSPALFGVRFRLL